MYTEIGAFDAKARLSEILRAVKEGHSYTITIRGKPIANLIPTQSASQQKYQDTVESLRSFKKIKGVSKKTLMDMITEGRKG